MGSEMCIRDRAHVAAPFFVDLLFFNRAVSVGAPVAATRHNRHVPSLLADTTRRGGNSSSSSSKCSSRTARSATTASPCPRSTMLEDTVASRLLSGHVRTVPSALPENRRSVTSKHSTSPSCPTHQSNEKRQSISTPYSWRCACYLGTFATIVRSLNPIVSACRRRRL